MIDVNIINDVTFATSFRGYDKDEVDNFLEDMARLAEKSNAAQSESEKKIAELSELVKKLEGEGASSGEGLSLDDANAEREKILAEARKTLESARAKEREAARALEIAKASEGASRAVRSAAEEGTNSAAKQEALRIIAEAKERAKAHTEAANAAIKKAIATAKTRIEAADRAAQERAQAVDRLALERSQASEREAFERSQASDLAAKERSDVSDRRAQERADAIVAEARGNADHLTAEAKANAAQILADAEAKVKDMFARAEASLIAKRDQFEKLRTASREFSGEYVRLLNGQLREMTELAGKVDDAPFGVELADRTGESLESVIPDVLDAELKIEDSFDELKVDDIDSMLEVDEGAADEIAIENGSEEAEKTKDEAPAADEADAPKADDDTYDFVGEPAAPDGTETDLSISDADLDRIFSFDVEEIMNEDNKKEEDK